jgi:oligopeptide/dipeptide ABC transporter ATP-binding protein
MEIGPAERVIRAPRNPYTQALVSVSPAPDPPTAGTRTHRTILQGETPDAAHVPTGCRFHPRCPLAFDRCTVEEPPLFDVGGGQAAACWLAEPGRPVMTTLGGESASPGIGALVPTGVDAVVPPSGVAPGSVAGGAVGSESGS